MSLFSQATPHLIILPILLPLMTAAVLVAVREKYNKTRSAINIAACVLNLIIACVLIYQIKDEDAVSAFAVYLTANWDVPFGISLLVDRFSALMLLIAGLVALAAALFAIPRWGRAGVHFHTLFQVQLMGINGAFLTADLFNLFVFFEILLAASYGLVLHGSGPKRVQAGLHYIAINLVASFFFLVGIALIYNTTGTLNFADIALYVRESTHAGSGMLYVGFSILGMAFLAKAAMWPINFWLVPAYSAATPPAAAMFALLTKVGMYILLRLTCLFFSSTESPSEDWFASHWLTYGGLLTLFFGALGILSTTKLSKLAAYAAVVSAGTLMAIVGFGQGSLTTAALYYLPASTLAIAAFFLIAELIERDPMGERLDPRAKETAEDRLLLRSYIQEPKSRSEERRLEAKRLEDKKRKADALLAQSAKESDQEKEDRPKELEETSANLDEREVEIVGRAIPAAMAFLGVSFAICALLIAGLPPLSSFIAKFGMLSALVNPNGLAASEVTAISPTRWAAVALIIASGFFALVSFSRAGIRYFWSPVNRLAPRLRVVEGIAIIILLAACILLTVRAEVSLRYTRATSAALYTPAHYIEAVFSARPVLAPNNQERLSQLDSNETSTSDEAALIQEDL